MMCSGSKRQGELSNKQPPTKKQKTNDNDEEDEFEKYMREINETASKQKTKALKKQEEIDSKSEQESIRINNKTQQERIDFNTETPMDSFIEQMQSSNTMFLPTRKGTQDYNSDEEVYNVAKYVNKLNRNKKEDENRLKHKKHKESELKYDDYGNIITPDQNRIIEDLEPIDHCKIFYSKFNKNFYNEHLDIKNMTNLQINELRNKYNIYVKGRNICAPVESFVYFGFDNKLIDIISSQNFIKPTPIQMQSIPLLLSGRDIIGLAKTGSGKTGAFIWPIIPHIMDQIIENENEIESGYDGAVGLIISPTRELASQTYKECKRYVTPFGIRVAPLYGGLNMYQQRKLLKNGIEIIIATPGRLIDLIKDNSTNMRRITYVVIDEVDKMFNLGFENQIRSIIGQIRIDKQLCMFSATMNKKIEKIAIDVLNNNYVHVSIGNVQLSNADITQYVEVIKDENYKFKWLKPRINNFIKNGLIIIFCQSKIKCEKLSRDLNNINIPTGVLHGGLLQNNRQEIINKFKKKKINILVATDVASRGVNIIDIKTVINYDCPHNMDSYIHRVGRTGRAGDKNGVAYTLLNPRGENDKKMANKLLEMLKKLRMLVSQQLQQMVNGEFENNNYNKYKYKNSLKNTFVKGSNQSLNTKQITHVFNNNNNNNNTQKKRKSRWGN